MREDDTVRKLLGSSVDYQATPTRRASEIIVEQYGMFKALAMTQRHLQLGALGLIITDCGLNMNNLISNSAFWYNLTVIGLLSVFWWFVKNYTLGNLAIKSALQQELLVRDWIIQQLIDNQSDPAEQKDMIELYYGEGYKETNQLIEALDKEFNEYTKQSKS